MMESLPGEDLPPIRSAANRARVFALVGATACINVIAWSVIGLAFGVTAALIGVFYSGYFGAAAPYVLLLIAFGPAVVYAGWALVRLGAKRSTLNRHLLDELDDGGFHWGSDEQLTNLIAGLSIAAGIAAPRGVVVEMAVPNAFAIGTTPANSTLGVTRGLIDRCSRAELEAIVALLVVRIASRDVALSTWVIELADDALVTMDNANERAGPVVAWDVGLLRLLTWPARVGAEWLEAKTLIGLGRRRDEIAVRYTRNPKALLNALGALDADGSEVTPASRGTAPLWVEVPLQPFVGNRRDGKIRAALTLRPRVEALRSIAGVPDPK